MATGLFPISQRQGGPRRGYVPKNRRGPPVDRARLDAFAEALAETGTVAGASRTVGICHQRGSQLLAIIRKELGWQAQ